MVGAESRAGVGADGTGGSAGMMNDFRAAEDCKMT